MSPVKSLIDANCLNLLRKKESPCGTLGRVGSALCGTRSSVRTRGCRVSPALGQGGLLKEAAQELQPPCVRPLPASWMGCAREYILSQNCA